jgi:hypothetical protein
MSRKMFAPRIVSPATTPRYCATGRPSIAVVVEMSMSDPFTIEYALIIIVRGRSVQWARTALSYTMHCGRRPAA